ncbi:MAG: YdcF family protein, partial [Rectinema sp.]
PHAAYAREYLLARGIPPDRILPCVESSNTVEDAFLSAKALAGSAAGEIVIVTSSYHVPRAEFLFGIAFAGKALTVCAAEDRLDPSERRIREEHERRTLEALRANGVSWGGKILR